MRLFEKSVQTNFISRLYPHSVFYFACEIEKKNYFLSEMAEKREKEFNKISIFLSEMHTHKKKSNSNPFIVHQCFLHVCLANSGI